MVLAPYRGQGLGRRIFIAASSTTSGAAARAAVEGYPLHGTGHEAEDVWTGPESLYSRPASPRWPAARAGWSTASTSGT